jgi:integrase
LRAKHERKEGQSDKTDRTIFWHTRREGFGLQVTESGKRSWVVQYRANGKSHRMSLDGKLSLQAAERQAKALQGQVAHGGDPLGEKRQARAAETNSLQAVAQEFFGLEGKHMRSIYEREAVFRRYIFKPFGPRPINSIRRSEIVRMLDKVEKDHGPTAAQHALAALRRLFNWFASRDDDFTSPVVRGMARIKPKEQARKRVLGDEELRVIWKVCARWQSPYAAMLRFILLTATRLREASDMNRSELNKAGDEWTIPARRHKSKREFVLPLSKAAQEVLAQVPQLGTKGWVFTTNCITPISGYSKFKIKIDELVLEAQAGSGSNSATYMDNARFAPHRSVADESGRGCPRSCGARLGPRNRRDSRDVRPA